MQGRYAHGGAPERGINAIVKMNAVVTALMERLLPEIAKRVHPIAGPATLNLTDVSREGFSRAPWREAVFFNLTEGGSRRILAGCHGGDRLLKDTPQGIRTFFAQVVPMRDREAHPGDNPPLCTDPSSPLVQSLMSFMAERGNSAGRFPAWSDGGLLSGGGNRDGGVRAGRFGPGAFLERGLPIGISSMCVTATSLRRWPFVACEAPNDQGWCACVGGKRAEHAGAEDVS